MTTELQRLGDELIVKLPAQAVHSLDLHEGSRLDVTADHGKLVLTPSEAHPTLDALISRITPENRHDEIDWGPAVGKEVW